MNDTLPAADRPPAPAPAAPDGPRRVAFGLVLLAAAGCFAATMGARQSMGLFLGDLNSHTGLGLANISLAFAFGQLWWGLTQPVAGIVADRIGAGRVIAAGIVLVALGTLMIPLMRSTGGLILAIGVLAAGGAGLAGPSVLMAATARLTDPARRGLASGIVNAGGSFGQFLFAPIAQAVGSAAGWAAAVQTLGLAALLALPAAWVLRGNARHLAAGPGAAPGAAGERTGQALRRALADPSYRLLAAGFFVCGFHVAFIATHLPGVVAACGLPPAVGAWAIAVIGLANIAGSLAMGWALSWRGGRWRMKSLLAGVYLARAVAVLVFLALPKTATNLLVFSAVIGATYLSTVPPTAGLVARFFGPAHLATLFGVVMLAHQLGGFLGAYLGGRSVEWTGGYEAMWVADAVLAVAAALLHLPIREPRPAGALRPA
ncbi:MFS transporter [Piscinibacter sakaiensis]|uniref:Transmembrane transport protein n=1 Tax=Piscinibacter sakaiensis TaxID=1547922 RepID=A0A0K8P217_PISS1|nr:MFS transporter [Piscinibacter sakaiensis]GAP36604.1 transmembrane transport protein [Piscinibacter sakaiensis]